jgi:hypothetical protein
VSAGAGGQFLVSARTGSAEVAVAVAAGGGGWAAADCEHDDKGLMQRGAARSGEGPFRRGLLGSTASNVPAANTWWRGPSALVSGRW